MKKASLFWGWSIWRWIISLKVCLFLGGGGRGKRSFSVPNQASPAEVNPHLPGAASRLHPPWPIPTWNRWNQTVVPFQNGAVVFRKRFFISRVGFLGATRCEHLKSFFGKSLASWNPMTPGSIFFTYTIHAKGQVFSKICFHHTVIPIPHNYRWGLGRSLSPLRLASLSELQKNGWNNPHFLTPSQT